MIVLLALSCAGWACLAQSPRGSFAEVFAATLMLAPLMAIPVGWAMGTL